MMKVAGTIFIKDNKLLLVKPRKRDTYQMVGGGVDLGEEPIDAAIREISEELNSKMIVIDKDKMEYIMEFEEIATNDSSKKIYFYVYKYNGELIDSFNESAEIENFLWYDTSMKDIVLSNTLNHKVVPYCLENNLIK